MILTESQFSLLCLIGSAAEPGVIDGTTVPEEPGDPVLGRATAGLAFFWFHLEVVTRDEGLDLL